MAENIIKIGDGFAVNPKHVALVVRNPKDLATYVMTVGGNAKSDYDFAETLNVLNGKAEKNEEKKKSS